MLDRAAGLSCGYFATSESILDATTEIRVAHFFPVLSSNMMVIGLVLLPTHRKSEGEDEIPTQGVLASNMRRVLSGRRRAGGPAVSGG